MPRLADANATPNLPNPDLNPSGLKDLGSNPTIPELPELLSSPALPSLDLAALGPASKKISALEMLLTKEMIRSPDQWRLRTLEDQVLAIKESTGDSKEKPFRRAAIRSLSRRR